MRIPIDQIEDAPKELSYVEDVDALNTQLRAGSGDYHLASGLAVDLEYYRAGLDVFFTGSVHGPVRATCARCLEEFDFPLEAPITAVLVPQAAAAAAGDPGELPADDLGLSFYEGDAIDVTALVHEQTLLALPTRVLCNEACLGLCVRCGANLNTGPCGCTETERHDERLAVLSSLLRGK